MAGPLAGVKIIELAGIGPGPFCGMMLSDMGAELLRIDRANAKRNDDATGLAGDLRGVKTVTGKHVTTSGIVAHRHGLVTRRWIYPVFKFQGRMTIGIVGTAGNDNGLARRRQDGCMFEFRNCRARIVNVPAVLLSGRSQV